MSNPGSRQPFVRKAGEGVSVWSLGGRFTAKVGSEDAENSIEVVGPPPPGH
jgi:hypothetical protein